MVQSEPAENTSTTPGERVLESIDSLPYAGKIVLHENTTYDTIKEGLAHILVPINSQTLGERNVSKEDTADTQKVFYNPIQQFNRDLSVLAIRAFCEDWYTLKCPKAGSQSSRGLKRKRGTPDSVDSTLVKDGKRQKHESPKAACNELDERVSTDNGGASKSHLGQLKTDFHKGIPTLRILDALSASGLRALRYAQELPFTVSVTANDLSRRATENIGLNVRHARLEENISVVNDNAAGHMYKIAYDPKTGPSYDVIDLDPYGTAAPFVDSALQALKDGGLLCLTYTDAGVWASCGYPEKTYALYGGIPMKGQHSHEAGLRLILHSVASTAAKYGKSIEPLMTLSIDFYCRCFIRVHKSPSEVKFLAGKTMHAYNCDSGCGSWKLQHLARNQAVESKKGNKFVKHSLAQAPNCSVHCEHCGFKTHLSGPMWGGPLHNAAFLNKILESLDDIDLETYSTSKRVEGMVTTALEETRLYNSHSSEQKITTAPEQIQRPVPRTSSLELDPCPFFFSPSALAKVVHARAPSDSQIKGALLHAGFKVSRSHIKPACVKTNAPWSFIWEVMRGWIRQEAPIKPDAIKPTSAGWKITNPAQEHNQHSSEQNGYESQATEPESVKGDNITGSITSSATTNEKKSPEIVFDERLGRELAGRKGLMRYQINPRPNWGPMNRAKG